MEIDNTNQLPEEYQEGGYGEESMFVRDMTVGGGDSVMFTDKLGTRWGSKGFDDANAWIKNNGTHSFKNANGDVILDTDGVRAGAIEGGTSIFGWSSTVYFQAMDNNTVDWNAGTLKLADDTSYSIVAGSTGNISALTYIYLDISVSTTVLQTTTLALDATGLNKILVAVCEDSPTGKKATYQVFGGAGGMGVMITEDNVAANSFTGNVFVANTITSSELTTGVFVTNSANIANGIIGDAHITGTLTVGKTDAKCTDPNADQTSSNTAANIIGQGDLATLSEIGASNCNSTIISGGKIITGLLTADNIIVGTLVGRTIKANGGAGTDVWVSNNGIIYWKYGGSTKSYIYCSSSGDVIWNADDSINITFNDDNGDEYFQVSEDGGTAFYINKSKESYFADDVVINGDVYADSYNDFAEYFEATEEYGKEKISLGTTVVLENEKIRPAKEGEEPIGVISATAGFILGSQTMNWSGKYEKDEMGELQREEVERWHIRNKDNEVVDRDFTRDRKPSKLKKGQKLKKSMKVIKKVSKDFDENKKYTPRKDRTEWNVVGLIGKCRVLKGQSIGKNWIKLKEISNNVSEYLIK